MSVRILTSESGEQALYDSVTMTAFGPVHENSDFDLDDFLEWMPYDPRKCSQSELNDYYYKWLQEKKEDNYEPPEPDYNAPNEAERAEMMHRIQRDLK